MESRLCRLTYVKAVAESHLNLGRDSFPNSLVKILKWETIYWLFLDSDSICPAELASQSLSSPLG